MGGVFGWTRKEEKALRFILRCPLDRKVSVLASTRDSGISILACGEKKLVMATPSRNEKLVSTVLNLGWVNLIRVLYGVIFSVNDASQCQAACRCAL